MSSPEILTIAHTRSRPTVDDMAVSRNGEIMSSRRNQQHTVHNLKLMHTSESDAESSFFMRGSPADLLRLPN